MESRVVVRENWMTRKPHGYAWEATAILSLLLVFTSILNFEQIWRAEQWMPASFEAVFGRHEWWRPWTALLVHGDLGHLLSNIFLFIPFAYFLTSYFSLWFFPIAGFFMGGLTNLLVLKTMPPEAHLIGVSGVVYWMGAAYLTLYFLIDRRRDLRRRFASAIFISIILFAPEAYKREISYLSHLVGYASGMACGGILYLINRRKYEACEVKEVIYDELFGLPVNQTSNLAIVRGNVKEPIRSRTDITES